MTLPIVGYDFWAKQKLDIVSNKSVAGLKNFMGQMLAQMRTAFSEKKKALQPTASEHEMQFSD